MSDVERLIESHRKGGVSDSAGAFTIDFQKAREKLSRFQLTDPHEFLLKFVQAGHLAAQTVHVRLEETITVVWEGWDAEISLANLAERLASASLIVGDDPLTHLCVGLSALLGVIPEGVRLEQFTGKDSVCRGLTLGQTLEWEEWEAPPTREDPFLRITLPKTSLLSRQVLRRLLEERCLLTGCRLLLDGQSLQPTWPDTPGAHREKFFRRNEILAQRDYGLAKDSTSLELSSNDPRVARLRLTVDLDPVATIWLVKAGVMTQRRRLELGIPGLIGVVEADDVPTDLTGWQFFEGDDLARLTSSLWEAGREMLEDALRHTQRMISEGQPASASAPVPSNIGVSGCLLAALGFWVTCWAIGERYLSEAWILPSLFAWLLLPLVWVWKIIQRQGCEKDDKSDAAARQHLRTVLTVARDQPRTRFHAQ